MIPTVLVVEDNTLNLELVRDVLITAGMKVVEARTAYEGLQAAAELKPTIILLDIRLPGLDGYAVLERLKSNPVTASIPVVALTAQAMVGDREQGSGRRVRGLHSQAHRHSHPGRRCPRLTWCRPVARGPFMVTCDRDLVGRVLANLVGNAFKFTPEGGEVRIGLEATNGQARITITDTGPGIPAEHRQVIFEKFGQAPLGQAVCRRSAGLGLTFCKLAVEAHGGRIGVESPSGGGTRFWIEIPRMARSA